MKILYKNNKIALFSLCLLSFTYNTYSMQNQFYADPERAARVMADFVGDIERDIQRTIEEKRAAARAKEEQERKIADLEEKRRNAGSDREKELVQEEILLMRRAALDAEKRAGESEAGWDRCGQGLANLGTQAIGTIFDMAKSEHEAEQKLAQEAVKAEANRKATVEKFDMLLKACSDRKNVALGVAGLSAAAVGVFGAWHGLKLGADAVRHWYRNPTLAQETSLLSLKEKCARYMLGVQPEESKVSDVILEPKLAARVALLAESVKNTVKNGAYFRNILFYGPPGTGKTMLAQRIARSSGLEYIYFAASSLDQFSIEEALIKLTELFEFAKKSTKKLMIIIDESEALFANRDKELSEKARKMLNHILTYTGTESRNFMIVALTNRPEDLDSAFLSRCDEQIEIGAPSVEQRKQILDMYIKKYLINGTRVLNTNTSLFGKLFGNNVRPKRLIIEPDVFSEEAVDAINAKLNNFVGRDISKLVLAIQSTAYASANAAITKELVDQIVEEKVAQKNQQLVGFGRQITRK